MPEHEELFTRIHRTYDTLSATQRRIADYLSANVQEVIFYSISQLAEVLNTSEAALVRFAQHLGYSGFPQLRKVLIEYYKEHVNPATRIKSYLGDIKDKGFLYAGMVQKEIEYLSQSVSSIDKKTFDRAVAGLCRADTIYVFGSGANESLASFLSFRLNRFQRKTVPISDTGKNILEKLILLRRKDFVVVYAFYKASPDVANLLDFLRRTEIPNLLVTDTRVPLMIRNSQMVLCAKRGPFGVFHSPLVPMAITNALIIGVAEKLGDKAMESLHELSEIRTRYYHDTLSDLSAGGQKR